jgi:hypothetical protein
MSQIQLDCFLLCSRYFCVVVVAAMGEGNGFLVDVDECIFHFAVSKVLHDVQDIFGLVVELSLSSGESYSSLFH